MRHLARTSEQELRGDSGAPPVVPPGQANAAPTPANPNEVLAGAGVAFDYDKLAEAMVKAQARAAAEQTDQASEAVKANPGWTPPGSVTAGSVSSMGQGAAAAESDPNAQPS